MHTRPDGTKKVACIPYLPNIGSDGIWSARPPPQANVTTVFALGALAWVAARLVCPGAASARPEGNQAATAATEAIKIIVGRITRLTDPPVGIVTQPPRWEPPPTLPPTAGPSPGPGLAA